jgi:hypothetical protein
MCGCGCGLPWLSGSCYLGIKQHEASTSLTETSKFGPLHPSNIFNVNAHPRLKDNNFGMLVVDDGLDLRSGYFPTPESHNRS